MSVIASYHHFDGRHLDTGPIRNILAYQGLPAPHTGEPISEALLLGISGGITVGYFTFEYEGYLPHLALLTRNTFDPLETIFERLAVPREVLQSSKPEVGLKNLLGVLESGYPALVWADRFTLPYNLLPPKSWAMTPIVVYGIEGDTVLIADRSSQPLRITLAELTQARARVKENKFRVMTLDLPDMEKLPAAVQKGIWQCISLYTDAPPKGARENFGLAALQFWSKMLTNRRPKRSWERFFPVGPRLYSALVGDLVQPGAWDWICTWGAAEGAERGLYADFLEEAALLLNKPNLGSAAAQFRVAAQAWCALAHSFLPDEVSLLAEVRQLKQRKHTLFIQRGSDALDEIHAINQRLAELQIIAEADFPMSPAEVIAFREGVREHVLTIHDIEQTAVAMMQDAML